MACQISSFIFVFLFDCELFDDEDNKAAKKALNQMEEKKIFGQVNENETRRNHLSFLNAKLGRKCVWRLGEPMELEHIAIEILFFFSPIFFR